MSNNWSTEQARFIESVAELCQAIKAIKGRGSKEVGNLQLDSVAGSGKTSVIVHAAQFAPNGSKFLAFNKDIAAELKTRLPSTCEASTFHAMCFRFLKQRLPSGLKVNGFKTYDMVRSLMPDMEKGRSDIKTLVSLCKNNGVGILEPLDFVTVENLREDADIFNEEIGNEALVDSAIRIMKKADKSLSEIDFDDMIYLTLKLVRERGWMMDRHPLVFLDEAQDTNAVQLALIPEFADNLVAVGDEHQAIYAFRGAGSNSMANIEKLFNTNRMGMTITWRCGKRIVEKAQQFVPHIKEAPNAGEGELLFRSHCQVIDDIEKDSMVLCRNNFPLFEVAMKLLLQRKTFKMRGKFPGQLIRFVRGFKAKTIQEFRVRLYEWWEKRQVELAEKEKWGVLAREEDKFKCLDMLQKESTDVDDLLYTLDSMMTGRVGPVLSTVHGAKGLEADHVMLLRPDLMPSKYATTEEALQQEENLQYVAVTRAKEKLVYYVEEG